MALPPSRFVNIERSSKEKEEYNSMHNMCYRISCCDTAAHETEDYRVQCPSTIGDSRVSGNGSRTSAENKYSKDSSEVNDIFCHAYFHTVKISSCGKSSELKRFRRTDL